MATTENLTVSSKQFRNIMERVAQATDAYTYVCKAVTDAARKNAESLAKGERPSGFSKQTLIECATKQAEWEQICDTAHLVSTGPTDMLVLEAVVADPSRVWSIVVRGEV